MCTIKPGNPVSTYHASKWIIGTLAKHQECATSTPPHPQKQAQ